MRVLRAGASLILWSLTWTASASPDVAVVVSPKVSVKALTVSEISDIFLGRINRLPDGTPVVPCDLAENSPVREEFYTKVMGKTSAQIRAHWSKIVFTGRGQPPREAANSREAKRLVVENPGMICYIDKALVDRSVKVLHAK